MLVSLVSQEINNAETMWGKREATAQEADQKGTPA